MLFLGLSKFARWVALFASIFLSCEAQAHLDPAVNLLSPTDRSSYAAGATIPLVATATASEGSIVLVEFFANDVKIAEAVTPSDSSYRAEWNSVAEGAYTVEAIATDTFGARGYSPRSHIVVSTSFSNQPPRVAIIEPIDGRNLRGPRDILLRAAARDNDGSVTRIEFLESGRKLGEATVFPFNFLWHNVSLGSYSIRAVAFDNLGASNSSPPVTFSVSAIPAEVIRGPYLQNASPTALNVNWRTDAPVDSAVFFGTQPGTLDLVRTVAGARTNHSVRLTGLSPNTRYFYAIGSTSTVLETGAQLSFVTPPATGRPTRIWVLGDAGTANFDVRAVRDAYYAFAGESYTDLLLMLGDNAYESGTDAEYQEAVFNMFPKTLRQSVLWPTVGNHESDPAYFDIFTLPAGGEAGGAPSGTESYYSFDYGNIHFVCLNAFQENRSVNGPMLTWLEEDLSQTVQDWIIAFWHHPPYSHGSHNSDSEIELIEMRENALPILEAHGVDLVLCGHSHNYERSYLLNGHYGGSDTFSFEMVLDIGSGRALEDTPYFQRNSKGTVYVVAGSSGQHGGGTLDYPAMFTSIDQLGSMVLDVNGVELEAKFLQADGQIADCFTIEKVGPTLGITGIGGTQLALSWAIRPRSYIVEATDRLGIDASWRSVTNVPTVVNGSQNLQLQNPGGSRFFRLRFSP